MKTCPKAGGLRVQATVKKAYIVFEKQKQGGNDREKHEREKHGATQGWEVGKKSGQSQQG